MTDRDAQGDRSAVVFVAEPVTDNAPATSRTSRLGWIAALVVVALMAVTVIVWRHAVATDERPTTAAPTHVAGTLCPTTCESSNGTAHMRAVIVAAIEDAFDRATQVRVNTLTSTVVPGTERTLLRRYVTATVPDGSLTVVVSTTPAGGSPFGEAPATTASTTTAQAVVDDYYVSVTLRYSPGVGQAIDAGLRQLVHDPRLVEQR